MKVYVLEIEYVDDEFEGKESSIHGIYVKREDALNMGIYQTDKLEKEGMGYVDSQITEHELQ